MNVEPKSEPPSPERKVTILLIDDDPNDALLVQRAMKKVNLPYPVVHRSDGEEAIEYLSGKPPYSDRAKYPLPALILLDIKMPKLTGLEVLAWIQGQPSLAHIPVVILTASVRQEDRQEAEKLGAVGYRTKPVDFLELVDIIRDVNGRWLSNQAT